MMFNFKLKPVNEIVNDGYHGLVWFWLTDGELWLTLGDITLYKYRQEALEDFGDTSSPYNQYPLVRFIEDFTSLFEMIREPLPHMLYQKTENLMQFLADSQRWLELHDENSNFYFEEYDNLTSWIGERCLSAGHLIGGPRIYFFRYEEKIKIVWDTEYELESGITLWHAKNGMIEMAYSEFIAEIELFGRRFFQKMKKQVEFAIEGHWAEVLIDKKRLLEEHFEREEAFLMHLNLLKQQPIEKTDWLLIKKLKKQMEKEISKEANEHKYHDMESLSKQVMELKNKGVSFLGCVEFVQHNQKVLLLEARELLLKLKVYSQDEKTNIAKMHNLMLSEFKE